MCIRDRIKADTIYVQMPGGYQNLCEDTSNFDTFVFYKPIGFGSTMWRIDGVIVGSGDSLLFAPTTIASFAITSSWNGNVEGCVINLHSSPPPHSQFMINGVGGINASNDTVSMCGSSVSLFGGTTSETASYTWYGPSGFTNTYSDPITLTQPGTYWLEKLNVCGSVADTFEVIQPNTSMPDFGPQETFCNAFGPIILDATPGYTYLWSTGDTTQTLTIDTSGTYTVTVTNACITGAVSKTVFYENYPLPVVSLSDTSACYGEHIVLRLNDYAYTTYQWQDGSSLDSLVATETGQYDCIVTQGECSESINTINLLFRHVWADNPICIATVDATTGHNKVAWQPTQNVGTVSYNIYKLNGTYTQIGTVANNDTLPLLVFNDTVSNPMTSAVRYKISAVDTCGAESVLSFGHGTIKINSNPGTGGGVDLTIADSYWDESGLYSPSRYYVLIDSLNDGSLHVMDSIDAVFNSYTISNPFAGATYVMGVAFPWACNNGSKSLSLSQMSFSNKSSLITAVMAHSSSAINVSLYPNPSTGIFQVQGKDILHVVITDMVGKEILSTDQHTFDLGSCGSGIYTAIITTSVGSTVQKLIVNQ